MSLFDKMNKRPSFEWDEQKDRLNQQKHGVSFSEAQNAFFDENCKIAEDLEHSSFSEKRYFCFGKVNHEVLTVRFIWRNKVIRIFGAGYWRRGKKIYEKTQEN